MAFLIPNVEEFFTNYLNIVRECNLLMETSNSTDGDHAELLFRRLQHFEEIIRIMYQRIRETRPHQAQLTSDFERMMIETRNILTGLAELFIDRDNEDSESDEIQRLCSSTRTGRRGRPSFSISESQIYALRDGAGFRWTDIARILGVSTRTLTRHRVDLNMPVGGESNFSNIDDSALENVINDILTVSPQAGIGLIRGALRARGLRVQRRRIIETIHRLDPVISALRQARRIIRRRYNVPCPNALWHIDGDHKLIQYRIVIHGGIDGFSRLVVYLQASTNNRAITVLNLFLDAIQEYNQPSRVRSDRGLENIEVGRFMIETRGVNRGSIITGNSVHNQRIERLWREVNRLVVHKFVNIFVYLERCGVLNPLSESHLYCLHLVYLPLINHALQELTIAWNNHPVTTESNFSPRQLWVEGMVRRRNSSYVAVRDVFDNQSVVNVEDYGIEEDGPVPALDDMDGVVVPESVIVLTTDNINWLREVIANASTDEYGITAYAAAVEALDTIAH